MNGSNEARGGGNETARGYLTSYNPHMAALSDAGVPRLIELRNVRTAQLDSVLAEETRLWTECLDWDFEPSADLVRRFIGMRGLSGYALEFGNELIGYAYFVCEDAKGLLGDVYIRRDYLRPEYEDRLMEAAIGSMVRSCRLQRIEAQLMLLPRSLDRPMPFAPHLQRHRRDFMSIDSETASRLSARPLAAGYRFEPWSPRRQERAAGVIADAYHEHVDSDINDQYRSLAGARRFLLNIVQYPGCGAFFQPGSVLGVDEGSGELAGLSLASLVSRDVGHITQICVAPGARGGGLGYELLRRSLLGLFSHGCRKVSLTVTAGNAPAKRLYDRMGFRLERSFGALVWEGFR